MFNTKEWNKRTTEQAQKMKQEEEQLQASQDGSYAQKFDAVFYGGRFDGVRVSHDELMKMGSGKFTLRFSALSVHNPLTINLKLEDQPIVEGYLSPMWDGDKLRYETQEVYNMLSD